MLTLSTATRVYLCRGATDLRKSFNGLHALVESRLREDPMSGHWFVFCNRRRDRVKVLLWDGSGLWVCAKRLERGSFGWPLEPGEGKVCVRGEELAWLLGGLELESARRRRWLRR